MPTIEYTRKLIDVETRLGFLFVPAKAQEFLPEQNQKIQVHLPNANAQLLTYNANYNRIFGLSSFYKDNDLKANSIIHVKIENQEVSISIENKKEGEKSKKESSAKSIDISNLSSTAKGNIMEDRIKEIILLRGQGMLNVYKPVIDNEGIDLIVLKNGQFHSLYLQVKSRYTAYKDQKLILTLSRTFKPHHSYYVVGVSFNQETMEIDDKIFLAKSIEISDKAIKMQDGKLRITASMNENSKDTWSKNWVTKDEFVDLLFEKFASLEEHYT